MNAVGIMATFIYNEEVKSKMEIYHCAIDMRSKAAHHADKI